MDCTRSQDLMSLALDGQLSEQESKELNQHLVSCPACAEEYSLYQSIRVDLRDMGMDEAALPEGFHQHLMNRIAQETDDADVKTLAEFDDVAYNKRDKQVIPFYKRMPRRYMSVAAVFALVVVFAVIGFNNLGNMRKFSVETMDAASTAEAPAAAEKAASSPEMAMESAPLEEAGSEPAAMMMDVADDSTEAAESDNTLQEVVTSEADTAGATQEAENASVITDTAEAPQVVLSLTEPTEEEMKTEEEAKSKSADNFGGEDDAKLARDGDISNGTTRTIDMNGTDMDLGYLEQRLDSTGYWVGILGGFLALMIAGAATILKKMK